MIKKEELPYSGWDPAQLDLTALYEFNAVLNALFIEFTRECDDEEDDEDEDPEK